MDFGENETVPMSAEKVWQIVFHAIQGRTGMSHPLECFFKDSPLNMIPPDHEVSKVQLIKLSLYLWCKVDPFLKDEKINDGIS